ncbi:hypothetical protein A9Q83_09715 [Alphaproteobacteria bacterium 46_93_T64]|nr:hypothetical protein A9Q83_09715 [Alphaproteobacteria bacterium 46_93_T64]
MRAMSKILLVFLLISYGPPLADAMDIKKRFNQSEIDDAYGQIDGIWTGTYNFVHSTTKLPETNIKSLDVKMIIKGKKLLFNIREVGGDWRGISDHLKILVNNLVVTIHAVNPHKGWLETIDIVIHRETKNSAKLYLQRSVNNWAVEVEGIDRIYSLMAIGNLVRQYSPAN